MRYTVVIEKGDREGITVTGDYGDYGDYGDSLLNPHFSRRLTA